MANTTIPIELSSTPGIVDNSNATAITIDSNENVGIGQTVPVDALDITRPSGTAARIRLLQSGYDSWQIGMPSATTALTFANSGTERVRIEADGIIRARSFRDVGHYLGPRTGVSVADDSTITITDNVSGAMMVSIYDAGTGSGALYFVNYQGDPQVIKSSGVLSFTDGDVDGFLCIYKTGAANSHTTVFKNRTGATRIMYISAFGSHT